MQKNLNSVLGKPMCQATPTVVHLSTKEKLQDRSICQAFSYTFAFLFLCVIRTQQRCAMSLWLEAMACFTFRLTFENNQ